VNFCIPFFLFLTHYYGFLLFRRTFFTREVFRYCKDYGQERNSSFLSNSVCVLWFYVEAAVGYVLDFLLYVCLQILCDLNKLTLGCIFCRINIGSNDNSSYCLKKWVACFYEELRIKDPSYKPSASQLVVGTAEPLLHVPEQSKFG